jgi:hypothetical protein
MLWPTPPYALLRMHFPDLACEGGHVYAQAVECWFWECP